MGEINVIKTSSLFRNLTADLSSCAKESGARQTAILLIIRIRWAAADVLLQTLSLQGLRVLVSAVAVVDRAQDHGDQLLIRAARPLPSALDHGPAHQPGERASLILVTYLCEEKTDKIFSLTTRINQVVTARTARRVIQDIVHELKRNIFT